MNRHRSLLGFTHLHTEHCRAARIPQRAKTIILIEPFVLTMSSLCKGCGQKCSEPCDLEVATNTDRHPEALDPYALLACGDGVYYTP